jgi:hypothetical protein
MTRGLSLGVSRVRWHESSGMAVSPHRSFKVRVTGKFPKYPAIPSPVPEAVHVSLAQNDERVLPKGLRQYRTSFDDRDQMFGCTGQYAWCVRILCDWIEDGWTRTSDGVSGAVRILAARGRGGK